MKGTQNTIGSPRYLAFDIHKEYMLADGINAEQEWVLPPRRVEMGKFREWAKKNLSNTDVVVLEITTNVWDIYDVVAPLVTRVVVAHAPERYARLQKREWRRTRRTSNGYCGC